MLILDTIKMVQDKQNKIKMPFRKNIYQIIKKIYIKMKIILFKYKNFLKFISLYKYFKLYYILFTNYIFYYI